MNVLCIGNSFSMDATRYLHAIARADGERMKVADLYIGGCSLERHYRNMLSGEREYTLDYNGNLTGFPVSLQEALNNRPWDAVTLQQCSPKAHKWESYEPYLSALADFVRKWQPAAKLYIHQTWAYASDSPRLQEIAGCETPAEMLSGIRDCYCKAAEAVKADGLIPSGELLSDLLASGVERIHRDGFHASYGLGRYALGLLWYGVLTGRSVKDNGFCDLDEPVSPERMALAKERVEALLGR